MTRVAVLRDTPLMARTMEELSKLGVKPAPSPAAGVFVLTDLSGLDTDSALRIAREAHQSGCRSMSTSRNGTETFLGPWAEPGHTACWNCFRQRFSYSTTGEDSETIADDSDIARTVAENVLLAVRYRDVAGYGCVVVDDGHTSVLHSVLPMPWCEVCGGAEQINVAHHAPITQSLLVPKGLRVLADTRGGILKRLLVFESNGTEAPTLPYCCTAVIGAFQEGCVSLPQSSGEGKGATKDAAVWSAIGEGLERYAASLWHPSRLKYAPFAEIEDHAFDPRWLILYDDEQYAQPDFPFSPFDPATPMHWTAGRWLDTGEVVWTPAVATYMHFPTSMTEQFGQTTSNGLAAGVTFEDAALRALYELIERDAFMLFWLARIPALRLALDGCDPITYQALREIERLGARTELYVIDAGTKHPTVVCLGLGDGRSWPGVTIGLAAHADLDTALQRAVLEHGHYGPYIRRVMHDGDHRRIFTSADVRTAVDHALYYIPPARIAALDSFRSGAETPVSVVDLRSKYRQDATLTACIERLGDAGIRAAAVDVTSPDVALAPLRVVRAFGTYMQPLHFGAGNQRLQNPRLTRLLSSGVETNPHPLA